MCLACFSNGPVTIEFLLEQVVPVSVPGEGPQFHECYDVLIKNRSDHEMTHLTFVSPQRLVDYNGPQPRTFDLIDTSDGRFDWPYHWSLRTGESEVEFQLPSVGKTIGGRFGKLEIASLQVHDSLIRDAESRAVADRLGFTVFDTIFKTPLKPYRENDRNTIYHLRLAFSPVAINNQIPVKKIQPGLPVLKVDAAIQTSEIIGPSVLLGNVQNRIRRVLNDLSIENLHPAARRIESEIVSGGYRDSNNTTRIIDHRVSVITGSKFCMFDTHQDALVGFWKVQNASSDTTQPVHAHTWTTGARYFPMFDPLSLTLRIKDYFRVYGLGEANSRTVEDVIASLQAAARPQNVEIVALVLASMGFLNRSGARGFFVESETVDREEAWDFDQRIAFERELRKLVSETDTADGRSFDERGFTIQFSLGFVL